jgi:hypothetical protein
MARTVTGRLFSLALLGSTMGLAACGGNASPTAVTLATPPPPPPAPRVIAQVAGPIPAETAAYTQFTVDATGKLEVTVDWTYATNDIDLFLVKGTCTDEQIDSGDCSFLATATSEDRKPERVSVASAATGLYTLYAVNWGPEDESASMLAMLTPGASGAAASSVGGRQRLRGHIKGLVPLAR